MKFLKTKLPRTIGVLHLASLPGSPGAIGMHPSKVLQLAKEQAVDEAKILVKNGFEGIILENFGDAPFYKTHVPPETIASMAVIASAVREAVSVPLGVNVLRNDARTAFAIAAVVGADFIRVNVLSGVVATDQGMIEGCSAELLRERIRMNALNVAIMADVHVKHAKTLSSSDLKLAIEETSGRGGADAIIITGPTTGRSPEESHLLEALEAGHELNVPIYIGSGTTAESLQYLSQYPVGMIVGSTLRKNGKAGAKLDIKRVQNFNKTWKSVIKN